ncbi:MAG: hypothetical protein KatS3mg022_1211 [Armatimonadota bacterium]|nr:MAG: hypothetical protein KatS3mg022_1211 [Armatimonadota bacterium]GIV20182.1 MAG: hypothetical protein KatS3mg023_1933 [Armatimonadota bacterium]
MRRRWEYLLWSAVAGAVWNVGLCSLVDLVTWQFRYFSHPLGIVWTGSVETLLWRGALVGAVAGWWGMKRLTLLVASVAAGVLLAGIHLVSLVSMGTYLRYALDMRVAINFALNGLLVGTVSGWLVRHAMGKPRGEETAQ